MPITIEVHTASYAPWEDGADERERLNEHTDSVQFENARDAAEWLDREGFGTPSVHPGPYDRRTWLSELDPYETPAGVLIERSAHFEGASPVNSPRLWAAIVHTVSREWTHYNGPYYVERHHQFDWFSKSA